jgi:hypothetical protein
VQQTRVRDNGLIVASIDWRDPDPDDDLRPQHAVLAMVLEHILEQVGGEHAHARSVRLDDAAWVGWRLVELLPLSDRQRQGCSRKTIRTRDWTGSWRWCPEVTQRTDYTVAMTQAEVIEIHALKAEQLRPHRAHAG